MRIFILLCLLSTSCADPHALTYTKKSDPVWALNPTMWNATANELTTAPTLQSGVQPVAAR